MFDPTSTGNAKDIQIVENLDDGSIIKYWKIKIPVPMVSDRDVVVQMSTEILDYAKTLMVIKSVEH